MPHRRLCPLIFMCVVSCTVVLSAQSWIGYGGPEGGRVYTDSRPPVAGLAIHWQTALPTWGHGQPIVVGNKVFLIREVGPDNLFPVLVCLQAEDGTIVWQHELDHLEAVKGNTSKLRTDLRAYWDREAELIAIVSKANGPKKNKNAPYPGKDKAQRAAGAALEQAMGMHRDKFRRGQYVNGYACFGDAFGTPVSDGQFIYATTTWGGMFCVDLAGSRQWVHYLPGGNWGWNNVGRSPILHKGVVYFDAGDLLRAVDARTGTLLWSHQKPNENSMVSPAVITIGDQDVLLTAAERAFLLPEGTALQVSGWKDNGMQILVNPDQRDVAYFCGSGEHCGWTGKGNTTIQSPAAFRFSLQGNQLIGKVLWHGGTIGGKSMWGGNKPWMVVEANRFYHIEGKVLDALTGKELGGVGKPRSRMTSHYLKIANDHIYGLNNNGQFQVFTKAFKPVSSMTLSQPALTAAQLRAHRYVSTSPDGFAGKKGGLRFSYSSTFTFGQDKIFVRSMHGLICLTGK